MKVAYVAGPYRNKDMSIQARNIANAKEVAEYVWAAGYYALCPHLNSGMFDLIAKPEHFLNGYLDLIVGISISDAG